jgi:hypothetical protein
MKKDTKTPFVSAERLAVVPNNCIKESAPPDIQLPKPCCKFNALSKANYRPTCSNVLEKLRLPSVNQEINVLLTQPEFHSVFTATVSCSQQYLSNLFDVQKLNFNFNLSATLRSSK